MIPWRALRCSEECLGLTKQESDGTVHHWAHVLIMRLNSESSHAAANEVLFGGPGNLLTILECAEEPLDERSILARVQNEKVRRAGCAA